MPTGLSNGPLGKTVADPSKILETAPGVYNEEVFASLDWVLNEAAKRKIRLIIPIEVCAWHAALFELLDALCDTLLSLHVLCMEMTAA